MSKKISKYDADKTWQLSQPDWMTGLPDQVNTLLWFGYRAGLLAALDLIHDFAEEKGVDMKKGTGLRGKIKEVLLFAGATRFLYGELANRTAIKDGIQGLQRAYSLSQ